VLRFPGVWQENVFSEKNQGPAHELGSSRVTLTLINALALAPGTDTRCMLRGSLTAANGTPKLVRVMV